MKIELNEAEISGYIIDGLRNQGISLEGSVDIEYTQKRIPPGISASLAIGEDVTPALAVDTPVADSEEEDTEEAESNTDVSDPFS